MGPLLNSTPSICLNCKTEIIIPYGNNIFCSKQCQLKYGFEQKKEEARYKAKQTNKKKFKEFTKYCINCGSPFSVKRYFIFNEYHISSKERTTCSNFCAHSMGGKVKQYKKEKVHTDKNAFRYSKGRCCLVCNIKIKNNNKSGFCLRCLRSSKEGKKYRSDLGKKVYEQVSNAGKHKSWQSRKIISYPEKFFINVLSNNNLTNYIFNFPISKRELGRGDTSNYFLDFYFPDKHLDLEIDGKQHEYEDRKLSDTERDFLLKNSGIIVYRIKWKKLPENNDYIKKEIDNFLSFYNQL